MKISKQYIKFLIILMFILGLISCKNSADSRIPEKPKVDSINISDNDESSSELTIKKTTSVEFTNETTFSLPKGYKLFEKLQGNLNGDDLPDYVLIIKETKKENVVVNRFDKKVDRNRRGVMIYLTNERDTVLVTKNLNCFSSENEDGGVYFPPQLSIDIEKGKLYIHYDHGRYGHWKYTFRYQNSDFELIGYDSSDNYGPIINRETSINFLTKKKLTRENVNQNTEKSGDEVFEEKWEKIVIEKLYKLSDIKSFEELDINTIN